jgi:pimeloyl-ACP methyl ester carboxylesterase
VSAPTGTATPVPLRRGELVVDGIRSPLAEAGPADAEEAVVFIHGNPGSHRDWEDLTSRIGEFGRAVAFDMPGFGQAEKPRDFPYTVDAYADHVAAAVDQLGVRGAHIVVHDFGGPFGLLWAIQNPDALRSVVMINTGVLIGYRWHRLARMWRRPVIGELIQASATRWAWRRAMARDGRRGLPLEFVDRMYDDYDRGTKRAVLKLYRSTPDLGELAPQLAEFFRPLDLPALVVWGKHDPYITVDFAEVQRQSFPGAEIVVLEESGHFPFADDPEGTAAEVVPFLREQMTR